MGRKLVAILVFGVGLASVLPCRGQDKPLTQDQVQGLVRDGLGDDSGAKIVQQRGTDFAPSDEFIQRLKTAGASDQFLRALRAAHPAAPAGAVKPINQVQLLALLAGGVPTQRVTVLVKARGIDFDVKDDFLQEVRQGGGDAELMAALKSAVVTKPAVMNAAAQTQQDEARAHTASGLQFANKGDYGQAEREYRAALQANPDNADLNVSLAFALIKQQKWDDAIAAERTAIRLDPNNDMAHNNLGVAWGSKGDLDAAIPEFREAIRLNPNLADAHSNLGTALGIKGDVNGAILEYRETLRLNPKSAVAHFNLGVALDRKNDLQGALDEFQAAYTLDPNDPDYKRNYERLEREVKR